MNGCTRQHPHRRSSGFALILVIWGLLLLTSLATGFALAVRHETRVAADLSDIARAEAAATAALHTTILALGSSDRENRWVADTRRHILPWPSARISVRVQSESGRIDINRAPRDLLIGLFAQLFTDGDVQALADRVIDWRDRDDRPQPDGAEKNAYIRSGYLYQPPNTAFYSVDELSQVMGFNNSMVARARPYLTVHSRQPRVNAISADLVVLKSIPGVDHRAAEAFIAHRESALAEDGDIDYSLLRNAKRYVDTRLGGKLFSLEIEVRLNNGLTRREHAVMRISRRESYSLLAREILPVGQPQAVTQP